MATSSGHGYDAAQSRREDDDLDRWRFAADIVEVILATPAEWSARIGVFGKWGEGKSTVLRFAEEMLRARKAIVFWFNPWAIRNWNDLWSDFGGRLSAALFEGGIKVDNSWLKKTKESAMWLNSAGVGAFAKFGASVLGREKVAEAAFGLLNRWLRYDGPQVQAIREKARDRRIVVLIDDLDRCLPELLPQLLLSLREFLDLPGFTFVLAFDDEIVAQALSNANPAWHSGSDFLEKILDFRFHLPPVTQRQKERLVSKAIAKYCSFVPDEATKQIQDLLPSGPRKLKALIRSFAALRPQIDRHEPGEFNWVDMWLAQMLRVESYPFLERLLVGDTLDREAGVLYQLLRSPSRSFRDKEDAKEQTLEALIAETGVNDPEDRKRLVRLIEAVRSRSSPKFRYACELAIRPDAVTWKEFHQLFAEWCHQRDSSILQRWVQRHAAEGHVNVEDVRAELFDAILNERQAVLAAAADSSPIAEFEADIGNACLLLEMAEQYLADLKSLGEQEFRRIYSQALQWAGFQRNSADRKARAQERALLSRLASAASVEVSPKFFEVVYPQDSYDRIFDAAAAKGELRRAILDIILPKVAKAAVETFGRRGGVRALSEQGRFLGVRHCLFDPRSPVWEAALKSQLFEAIGRGREDPIAYENSRDFFRLLAEGLEHGVDGVKSEDVARLVSDGVLPGCLWDTLVTHGIQYRMQFAFIGWRGSFIRHGVPEGSMPLTEELTQRLKEIESAPAQSSSQPDPS